MNWLAVIFLFMSCVGSLSAYSQKSSYSGYSNDQSQLTTASLAQYCAMGNDRVCGTNGFENFLFDNTCEFNDYNGRQMLAGQLVLEKISLRNCYSSSSVSNNYPSTFNTYCPQYCTRIFKPVCGSYKNVQRNFTNECEMRRYMCQSKENWQLILNDTCVGTSSCPLEGQELCASFDNLQQAFPNLLSLYKDIRTTGRDWQILNVGPCPCPTDYRPICATLNCTTKTFQNECFLQQEIKSASYWSILFIGECPTIPVNTGCNNNGIPTIPTTTPASTTTTSAPDSNNTTTTNSTIPTTTPAPTSTTTANGTGSTSTTPVPNCNLPSLPNTMVNNRPVYIVKLNKILPYGPQNNRPSTYGTYAYGGSKTTISPDCGGSLGGNEGYVSPDESYRGSYQKPTQIPSYSRSYKESYQTPGGGSSYNPTNTQYSSSYSRFQDQPAPSTSYQVSRNNVTDITASLGYGGSYAPATPSNNLNTNSYSNAGYYRSNSYTSNRVYSNSNNNNSNNRSNGNYSLGGNSGYVSPAESCTGSYQKPTQIPSYSRSYKEPYQTPGGGSSYNPTNTAYSSSYSRFQDQPAPSTSYQVSRNNVTDTTASSGYGGSYAPATPSNNLNTNSYSNAGYYRSNSYTSNRVYSNSNNNGNNRSNGNCSLGGDSGYVSPAESYRGSYQKPTQIPSYSRSYKEPYQTPGGGSSYNPTNTQYSSSYSSFHNQPDPPTSYQVSRNNVTDTTASSGYGGSYAPATPSNNLYTNSYSNAGYHGSNSYTSNRVYSNSNKNNGNNRSNGNYRADYSSKYKSYPVESSDCDDPQNNCDADSYNDRGYEGGYDSMYESFT